MTAPLGGGPRSVCPLTVCGDTTQPKNSILNDFHFFIRKS